MASSESGAPRRRPTRSSIERANAPSKRPSAPDNRASSPAGPQAKLVGLAGPAKGKEFRLSGDELTVGRSGDNAISIPDTSVSRKHVLLRNVRGTWAASDMGSGNGTVINSQPIAEETRLSDGDVISMGDTELKFVTAGASETDEIAPASLAPRASREIPTRNSRPPVRVSRSRMPVVDPQAQAKRRIKIIRIGALVALVLMVVGGVVLKRVLQPDPRAGQAAILEKCRVLAQEGKNLVREGKWADAKDRFVRVLDLNPQFGNGTIQQYVERAEKEIPVQYALDAAEAALAQNQLGLAKKELEKVTSDTQQYERRDKLTGQIETKMQSKTKEALGLVTATNDRAKMVKLKEMAEDLLAVKPDFREGLELKKIADDAIDRIDHPTVCPHGTCGGKCCPAPTPWAAVQERFKSGDQTGAFALAQQCAGKDTKCRQLQDQIRDFGERFKKLETLTPPELVKLMELDRKIAGGPSAANKQIGVRVTGTYLRKASSCKAKGDMACAAENANIVLQADPENIEAQDILREAKSKVRDMFQQAYSMKQSGDPDGAAIIFKKILEMTAPSDEYYVKAQKQLKRGE